MKNILKITSSFGVLGHIAIVCVAILSSVCFALPGNQPSKDSDKEKIISLLTKQDECWNEGDIEGFMQTYWKSPDLTFSGGGKTTRGWQATLDRYKKSYPPEKMGKLNFDGLEVTLLSDQAALVLGNWHLDLKGDKSDGNFTLVMRKFREGWKIIHDHSSTIEKDEENPSDKIP